MAAWLADVQPYGISFLAVLCGLVVGGLLHDLWPGK